MHGNGCNRWFDKSISLVVFPDGQAGLNVEHTIADAPAVAHLWEFALTHEWHSRPYSKTGSDGNGGNCVYRDVDEVRTTPKINDAIATTKLRGSVETHNELLNACQLRVQATKRLDFKQIRRSPSVNNVIMCVDFHTVCARSTHSSHPVRLCVVRCESTLVSGI